MSAHLRPINTACDMSGCRARATAALYTTINTHVGNFCIRHGRALLREILKKERRGP